MCLNLFCGSIIVINHSIFKFLVAFKGGSTVLYYNMRNFCNLIGLEQWYFSLGYEALKFAVAKWPVTGQSFQNTKWPAVLYSQ